MENYLDIIKNFVDVVELNENDKIVQFYDFVEKDNIVNVFCKKYNDIENTITEYETICNIINKIISLGKIGYEQYCKDLIKDINISNNKDFIKYILQSTNIIGYNGKMGFNTAVIMSKSIFDKYIDKNDENFRDKLKQIYNTPIILEMSILSIPIYVIEDEILEDPNILCIFKRHNNLEPGLKYIFKKSNNTGEIMTLGLYPEKYYITYKL